MRFPFLLRRERIAAVPVASQEEALSTGKSRETQRVVPPFPKCPKCLSPLQRNLISLHCVDFHVEYRLTPRWHVWQPCGESLKGKPQILESPLDCKKIKQSILKLSLKLKLHFGHSCKEVAHWKRPWCWENEGQNVKRMAEDKMVVWHHWYNEHELGQALGNGEGQRGLACCSLLSRKESDMT